VAEGAITVSQLERSTLGKRIAANQQISDEVLRKSREGETPLAVASWLQEELLLFTEAGREELAEAVRAHFLVEVPLEERLEIHRTGRNAIAATVARQRRNLNARERLEVLMDLQMGRLELGHQMESATGEFLPAMGNEVEVARRIAMNIHEVEVATGADGAPRSVGGALSGELGAKLGKLFHVLIDAIPDPKEGVKEPETVEITVEQPNIASEMPQKAAQAGRKSLEARDSGAEDVQDADFRAVDGV
jgi:hypothetical protein